MTLIVFPDCLTCKDVKQEIERAAKEGTHLDRDIIGKVYRDHLERDHGWTIGTIEGGTATTSS